MQKPFPEYVYAEKVRLYPLQGADRKWYLRVGGMEGDVWVDGETLKGIITCSPVDSIEDLIRFYEEE